MFSGVGDTVDVMCGVSECETTGPENEACFPILVTPDDPAFGGQECLKFVRTQETPIDACRLSMYLLRFYGNMPASL